jgi:hypothetical protein
MKVLTLALALLYCMTAAAKDKAQYVYQDGILASFSHVTADARGGVDTRTDDDVYYTVSVGDRTYVLSHVIEFLHRPSDLQGLLPGTHVWVRMDKKALYVRVNEKESKFDIVQAK